MSEDQGGTLAGVSETLPHHFKPGNQLWKMALMARRANSRFSKPDDVVKAFCEYMQWVEDNPLQESKLVTYEGNSSLEEVPRMRTPSLSGLCAFMSIHRDTWGQWRRGDTCIEFKPVVEWCEQIMHEYKLSGASAGLLNPMVIVRELGLVERQQVDNKTTVVIEGDEAKL